MIVWVYHVLGIFATSIMYTECTLDEAVDVFALSSCDDISEVGPATISVPAKYPAGVFLNMARSCRFQVHTQNHVAKDLALNAILEVPFMFASGDYLMFLDGSLQGMLPKVCDPQVLKQKNPLITTLHGNSAKITKGISFNSTTQSMVIDFCSSGIADYPVSFFITLSVPINKDSELSLQPLENGQVPHISSPWYPHYFPSAANKICGLTSTPPDRARIVNGQVAHAGYFPWMVAMVHKKYKQYCGGSILNSNHILTAAHCVVGPLDIRDIQANTTIVIGTLDLAVVPAANSYAIAEIVVHPNYDPKGWLNDIAIIKLKRTIPHYTDSARSVCLPNRPLAEYVQATNTTMCYIAGWGYTKEAAGLSMFRPPFGINISTTTHTPGHPVVGAGSDKLLFARMTYVPQETCKKDYYSGGLVLQGTPQFVRENMVCASNDVRPQGACLGDSGGGLYCREPDGTWGIHGVSSWSGGCARKDLPSVFANVFHLRSLILRVLTRDRPKGRR